VTPFGPTAEMIALADEISRWPVATSLEQERAAWDATCAALDPPGGETLRRVDAGGVPAAWVGEGADVTVLYSHGGAFALGSAWHVRGVMARLAAATGGRVLGVDYRLAPEHGFPAAPDDVFAAYRWLLDTGTDPATIVLAGDSCGGTLALTTALRAAGAGLPGPAGVAVVSPWVDLTQSGFSYATGADPWITKTDLAALAEAYLGDADPTQPDASPLFGALERLPPLLVQVGAGEALLADALSLTERAAQAGVATTLEVWPHAVHVWTMWASRVPEAQAALDSTATFARACVASPEHH
jgi:acetyl esterase/lipase